jgi:hypothetical protein
MAVAAPAAPAVQAKLVRLYPRVGVSVATVAAARQSEAEASLPVLSCAAGRAQGSVPVSGCLRYLASCVLRYLLARPGVR